MSTSAYRNANREKIRKSHSDYKKNNKSVWLAQRKRYRIKNRDKVNALKRAYNKRLREKCKQLVLEHYNNQCNCCGEKEKLFLSVDHINNGRNNPAERKYANINIYLVRNNFPDGFQILCYNCNLAKGFFGKCPHTN